MRPIETARAHDADVEGSGSLWKTGSHGGREHQPQVMRWGSSG
jgi:hypothetical protein